MEKSYNLVPFVLDHLLYPINHKKETFIVDIANITSSQPPVRHQGFRIRLGVIHIS